MPITRLLCSLCFYFALISFYSCGDTKRSLEHGSDQFTVLDFTVEYDSTEIRLEDIADSIEVIRMETTPESLLGYFHTTFSENYILCLTRDQALLFDKKGHFLGNIGQMGKGPNEFRGNSRWAIDEINDLIYCYNQDNSQMIRFDLERRKMVNSFNTDTKGSIQEMILLNKDSIAAIKHVNRIFPYEFYYLSTKGDFLGGKAWDTTKYFHSGTYSNAFFHKYKGNKIIYQPSNSDSVYEIRGDQSIPILTFDKKSFPSEGNRDHIQKFHLFGIDDKRNAIFYMREVLQEKDGQFVLGNETIESSFYTYNSENQKITRAWPITYTFNGLSLKLDKFFIRVRGMNSFYCSIPAVEILDLCDEFLQNNPGHKNFGKVSELKSSLDINDNPIIITGKWDFANF